MRIFTRYINGEFFKLLVLCLLIFVAMYLLGHFFDVGDNFVEASVPRLLMFHYFLFKIPYIIVQMLPPAVLVAIIIMFSIMKKNNEIMALKGCGVNIWRLSQPVITTCFFLAIGLFFFSETVVPYASSRSNEIWRVEVKKQASGRFYGKDHIWYRGSDTIYFIRHFDNKKRIMGGPSFYFFDPSFRLYKRIDGKQGVWKDGKWVIKDGLILEALDDGEYHLSKFKEMDLWVPEAPDTFVEEKRMPEEMNCWQLARFANRTNDEGYDATEYFVDLNIKIAFPLIVIIMALIGIPVALGNRRGGTPAAIALGVVLCFLYILVLGVSRAFGLGGVLPPVFSAWVANGVFLLLGTYLMMNVEQ
jgi:lipopolysaccharide export system permease protein